MKTERLEASLRIDTMTGEDIVRLINAQDRLVPEAVGAAAVQIARAVEAITDRLSNHGRMFYVGAGTSGRMAMLDASELPPTYGIDPSLVQVIMAGGERAFQSAAEGAEDDDEAAIAEINARVKPEDCVIGVAASGTTPFTMAAIRRANMIGALTVGITSASSSPLAQEPDIPIVVETGPEVILGSSRMKSGTAQKLILNTISTAVMIRLGKVYSNLMVEMPATNEKLRNRSVLMIEMAAGVDRSTAARLFAECGNIKQSIVAAKKKVSTREARSLLDRHGGRLREVLGD